MIAAGVILAIALLIAWLVNRFYRKPLQRIYTGMNLLSEQDFSSRLRPVGQRHADKVVAIFNDMMERLKVQRLHVREQNEFLDLLIRESPTGVVIFDSEYKILQANPTAAAILGKQKLLGARLKDLDEEIAQHCFDLPLNRSEIVRLADNHQVFRISHRRFIDNGMPHPFMLLEPLTAEVLNMEREAYSRSIRTMAHEVNNTAAAILSALEAIESSVVGLTADERSIIQSCSSRMLAMTRFIRSYAEVVKVPEPKCELTDFMELVNSCRPLLESICRREGVEPAFNLDEAERLRLDPVLMQQVLVNIVKNAAQNAGDGGRVDIIVKGTKLKVLNTGPGLSPEVAQRIFAECISTKPEGQGLGLLLVAEILRKHNARFGLSTDRDSGLTRFEIEL